MEFSRESILSTFEVFHEPGDVVEVRVPNAGRSGTISGYFNDPDAFTDAIMRLDSAQYSGIYFTINKINKDLIARSANNLMHYAKNTTADKDVERRCWLPIDLDPDRPAGISSSKEEHEAAIQLAFDIRNGLMERGWAKDAFVIADSGNGAHVLVRIDLPNDEESTNLVRRCLNVLSLQYGGKIKVDGTMFNASRIIKVYGTVARKGSSTKERPHRQAWIIDAPEKSDVVTITKEQLESLCAELKSADDDRKTTAPVIRSRSREFDPVAYAEKHGMTVIKRELKNGSFYAILDKCPFNPEHGPGKACIGRLENGARFFKCQHDSCKDNKWGQLKSMLEGENSPLTLADIKIEDICTAIEKKDSDPEFKFSTDKAARAILSSGELKIASWEARDQNPSIWVCSENNVWVRSGEYIIEKLCDDVAGSLSTGYTLKETKRRIKNDLRECAVEFDTGNPYLVGTRNGYSCNLMTGDVRKISPEDNISDDFVLPIDYDPDAICPNTFQYYDDVCSTDCVKMSLIDFDTSALMLESRREIHEWLGGGVNGKGVKQKHQIALFGPDTMTSININELNNSRFGPVELFRKRILTCSETDRSTKDGKEYSTSLLKQITGGDPITADVKNKEHIDFIPFCKVAIVANDPPRFDDITAGWKDRFRHNDFPYQFVEADEFDSNNPRHKRKDPNFINRITTPEELSGYLNVMLYRAQTIIKDGTTPKCKHITEGYEEKVYSLEAFINRFCEIDPEKIASQGYYVRPSDLFGMFDKWAEFTNASRMKDKAFFKIMTQKIGRVSHTIRVDGTLITGYEGIKFDSDKYSQEMKKIEESLKGQAACASSARAYADLKNKFASKSEPKFESVTESIASS